MAEDVLGAKTGPDTWGINWRPVSETWEIFGCSARPNIEVLPCRGRPVELASVYRGGLIAAALPMCDTHAQLAKAGGFKSWVGQIGEHVVALVDS